MLTYDYRCYIILLYSLQYNNNRKTRIIILNCSENGARIIFAGYDRVYDDTTYNTPVYNYNACTATVTRTYIY